MIDNFFSSTTQNTCLFSCCRRENMIDDVLLFLFSRACCIFTRSRPQTLQLCRPSQVSKCLSHDAMESSTKETLNTFFDILSFQFFDFRFPCRGHLENFRQSKLWSITKSRRQHLVSCVYSLTSLPADYYSMFHVTWITLNSIGTNWERF